MTTDEAFEILKKAWEPYFGAQVARERAGNVSMGLGACDSEDEAVEYIEHAIKALRFPPYSIGVSKATIFLAVDDAISALRGVTFPIEHAE